MVLHVVVLVVLVVVVIGVILVVIVIGVLVFCTQTHKCASGRAELPMVFWFRAGALGVFDLSIKLTVVDHGQSMPKAYAWKSMCSCERAWQ